jgi:YidC/Oxa1 family membrane protein insertase
MMVLPLFFLTVVSRFPVGLVLYWMTTNLWTVGQGLITRRLVPKTPAPSPFTRRRKPPDDSGNGARKEPPPPKPAPARVAAPKQRQVKRRKKGGARR